MLIAIVATLVSEEILNYQWLLFSLIIGSLIGVLAARLIGMTRMPELVALFNGFGGVASFLVGWVEFIKPGEVSTFGFFIIPMTIFVGGVTFSGSIVAWGKLGGVFSSKPVIFLGQKFFNVFLVGAIVFCIFLIGEQSFLIENIPFTQEKVLLFLSIISFLLGIFAVISIGGADMPVVIALLNAYSGLAACLVGFLISNILLIVAGSLVGTSGFILTNIMCKAMNRSIFNVLFSAFGSVTSAQSKGKKQNVRAISPSDAFLILEAAQNVVVVPGYGMATAQAQNVVKELSDLLEDNHCDVNFAIHPVAGRMPGHMDVLLAEANVPYEKLKEMDEINPRMSTVDVVLVIGANDVVNPKAYEDQQSSIYGMPVIKAEKAKTVFVLKRSMGAGFSGLENPLFFKENTRMLFGDAKASIQALINEFKS